MSFSTLFGKKDKKCDPTAEQQQQQEDGLSPEKRSCLIVWDIENIRPEDFLNKWPVPRTFPKLFAKIVQKIEEHAQSERHGLTFKQVKFCGDVSRVDREARTIISRNGLCKTAELIDAFDPMKKGAADRKIHSIITKFTIKSTSKNDYIAAVSSDRDFASTLEQACKGGFTVFIFCSSVNSSEQLRKSASENCCFIVNETMLRDISGEIASEIALEEFDKKVVPAHTVSAGNQSKPRKPNQAQCPLWNDQQHDRNDCPLYHAEKECKFERSNKCEYGFERCLNAHTLALSNVDQTAAKEGTAQSAKAASRRSTSTSRAEERSTKGEAASAGYGHQAGFENAQFQGPPRFPQYPIPPVPLFNNQIPVPPQFHLQQQQQQYQQALRNRAPRPPHPQTHQQQQRVRPPQSSTAASVPTVPPKRHHGQLQCIHWDDQSHDKQNCPLYHPTERCSRKNNCKYSAEKCHRAHDFCNPEKCSCGDPKDKQINHILPN